MEQKSSVSALQEFCAKAKTGNPVYDFIDGDEGGYICKVVLMDTEAFGNGRSKRDAKHLAAANIMRKLRKLPGFDSLCSTATVCNNNVDDSVQNEMANMNRDMLKELRDYCVRHDMPLPTIEIVQQSGQPNAPEFVACCSVASIKRYGKSDSKKDARQRAAIEMLCIISTSDTISNVNASTNLVSTKPQNADLDADLEDLESERRRKFKTYRELIDAGGDDTRNIKISDRHNYFKSFYPALKTAAFDVINSQEYFSQKEQLDVLLNALKLTSKVTQLESTSMEPLLQIELKCDLNYLFIGLESVIYKQIIQYLREMLI